MGDETFDIKNNTKGKLPNLPFVDIKNFVLGNEYELSLVFIGSTLSKRLNRERRGMNKPANVLSFPLTKTSGEIFIDIGHATKQSTRFKTTPIKFIGLLFIHGLHHLKGFEHGSKMEAGEELARKKFNI